MRILLIYSIFPMINSAQQGLFRYSILREDNDIS